ncbi:hypothetical protein QUB52_28535 [Microcoleus sp. A6-C6]
MKRTFVADEASKVLQEQDCSTTSRLPEPERSKALARVMALLSNRGSSEVERVIEAIALLNTRLVTWMRF